MAALTPRSEGVRCFIRLRLDVGVDNLDSLAFAGAGEALVLPSREDFAPDVSEWGVRRLRRGTGSGRTLNAHECQVNSNLNHKMRKMHARRISPSQLKVESIKSKAAVTRISAFVHSPPLHGVHCLSNSTLVCRCHEVVERPADDK